ncbi:phage head spike fiber domain-containing protein [Devosia sp.]|uniref:phage head spike fiber domain-containing protein n=1 Tax=Devosia sp. TaxID=1871048 RepID=UPI002FCB3359
MPGLGLSDTQIGPRHWWPADATFAIDFASGIAMRNRVICPLAEAMSLTRPSAKLARDSTGRWHSFAANVPAITDLGLSIEPERTNLVLANTANSGAGFGPNNTAIRTNLAPGDSPSGDAFGKLVTQGAGASDALYIGGFTGLITAGSTHAVSAAFKYSGSTRYLRIVLSDNVSVVRECWVDLLEKVASNTSPGSTARLTPLADDWLGLELIAANFPNTTGSGAMGIISVASIGNTVRQSGSYKMWGGQLERGQTTATSPILTTGMAVTRVADDAILHLPVGSQSVTFDLTDGLSQTLSTQGGNYTIPVDLQRSVVRRVTSLVGS